MTTRLADRSVIALSGPDWRSFLQGLVTNDVASVAPGALRYAALLTPQGKILFDFLMTERDGALLLDCPGATRDALVKRLSLYRLRAKVDIVGRDDLAVVWGEASDDDPAFLRDPRHPDLGYRAIVSASLAPQSADTGTYCALRVACGVPEGADFGQDKMFALDADLDELGGIAFDKGCYIGQELTARMKHRGTARKRLLPVETENGASIPPPDTSVSAQDRELGAIAASYGKKGFALVRLDRLAEADGYAIHAGAVQVRIAKPAWLFS